MHVCVCLYLHLVFTLSHMCTSIPALSFYQWGDEATASHSEVVSKRSLLLMLQEYVAMFDCFMLTCYH